MKILFPALAATVLIAGSLRAQISFTGSYSQNFNTLPTVGPNPDGTADWVDNVTLPGWYSSRDGIGPTPGSGSVGALKSFGSSSSSSERALGSLVTDSTGAIYYGVLLVNSTGMDLTSINISYFGETWRYGSSTASGSASFFSNLSFAYSFTATDVEPASSRMEYPTLGSATRQPSRPEDSGQPAHLTATLPQTALLFPEF